MAGEENCQGEVLRTSELLVYNTSLIAVRMPSDGSDVQARPELGEIECELPKMPGYASHGNGILGRRELGRVACRKVVNVGELENIRPDLGRQS